MKEEKVSLSLSMMARRLVSSVKDSGGVFWDSMKSGGKSLCVVKDVEGDQRYRSEGSEKQKIWQVTSEEGGVAVQISSRGRHL